MASRVAGQQKGNKTVTRIFISNGNIRKWKSKRKRVGVGVKKWPSSWRLAWINLGRNNLKVAVIYSSKTK